MCDFEIDATKGRLAREFAELFSASRRSTSKPKRVQARKRRPYYIYVVTVYIVYETDNGEDWVKTTEYDDDTFVVESYIHKPTSDVLANIAIEKENTILKYWKYDNRDIEKAHIEVTTDLSDLRESLVTCGNIRAAVSVALTKTKLKS